MKLVVVPEIDVRSDEVVLPDGKRISKKDVISIDTSKGIIVYRDRDGKIKTVKIW